MESPHADVLVHGSSDQHQLPVMLSEEASR